MADLSESEDDLSKDNATLSPAELSEELKDKILQRRFRQWAFWGAFSLVAAYFLALLIVIIATLRHSFGSDETWHVWLITLVILAAVPTTLSLALLRFAFREKGDGKDENDIPSVWLQMAKEIADIVKQYLAKKS
ncbi:sugar porter family MFS transporter [Salmonella enterica subsp. enterica]|uniref:Uncharacterized protein n=2 Tax=Salmonella enterica TaxID=28901 RepID=A0A7U7L728_SALER|nr:hypothetical protein [Salmonella enterica]EBK1959642.1 sugar porter family MFS transporter [Salmonella enterica subsp. enterica serovar Newport]ECI2307724.1 sugar porter family MFS transporter [Salmonella enterica subsp. enterica serovar Infantis]ECT8498420.1 hypothetical protein [Salmonella enterica subsp. enterica serovar Pensacola]EDY2188640.1 sugar porter family MFS transporter [Salmonella enterica subsp. enterica]